MISTDQLCLETRSLCSRTGQPAPAAPPLTQMVSLTTHPLASSSERSRLYSSCCFLLVISVGREASSANTEKEQSEEEEQKVRAS